MTRSSLSAVAGLALLAAAVPPGTAGAQAVSFENDIYPIFELRCMECHRPGGEGHEKSGLDLTSYDSLMEGTKHGKVVVPREYINSTLAAAVDWRVDPEIRMPYHGRKLSKCELLQIRYWIQQGAPNN